MCLPCKSARNIRNISDWNEYVREDRSRAAFWHRVWCEAGCPSASVLAEMKKHTKSRYKYAIRRVKHRRETIIRN